MRYGDLLDLYERLGRTLDQLHNLFEAPYVEGLVKQSFARGSQAVVDVDVRTEQTNKMVNTLRSDLTDLVKQIRVVKRNDLPGDVIARPKKNRTTNPTR